MLDSAHRARKFGARTRQLGFLVVVLARVVVWLLLLTAVALFAVAILSMRYDVLVPGPTEDTRHLIRTLHGTSPDGSLSLTSAAIQSLNPLLALRVLLDPYAELVPRSQARGVTKTAADGLEREWSKSGRGALAAACSYLRIPEETVAIEQRDFKGPSAGLMLALAVIDSVGGTNVTRGRHIAGTGAISPDGRVYEIGAVAQKVNAAERDGAEIFLVPITQVNEAKRAASKVRIVGVRDLSDALAVLRSAVAAF